MPSSRLRRLLLHQSMIHRRSAVSYSFFLYCSAPHLAHFTLAKAIRLTIKAVPSLLSSNMLSLPDAPYRAPAAVLQAGKGRLPDTLCVPLLLSCRLRRTIYWTTSHARLSTSSGWRLALTSGTPACEGQPQGLGLGPRCHHAALSYCYASLTLRLARIAPTQSYHWMMLGRAIPAICQLAYCPPLTAILC